MKCPFKFEWREITPAQAREWLKQNTHNRALREVTVAAYARDMKLGAWSPNHQGIAFSAEDKLIDGQHRLAAIVEANVPVWMLVFTGVPIQVAGVKAKVMETIDRGNARSIPDLLRLDHGYKGDANMIAAACLAIGRICVADPENQAKKSTMPQTVAVLQRYRDGLKYVSENRPTQTALRGAAIAAAVAFAYGVRPQHVADFYEKFKTGAGLHAGSPILTLRNHVQEWGPGGANPTGQRQFIDLVLHALWCHAHGENMARIPAPGEGRQGSDWWRAQQANNVSFIAALFPKSTAGQTVDSVRIGGAPVVKRSMKKGRRNTRAPMNSAPAKAAVTQKPTQKVPASAFPSTVSRAEGVEMERVKVTLPMRLTVMQALDEWMEILKDPAASRERKDAFHRRYKILSACEEHGDNAERLSPVTFEDLVPRKAVAA